MFHSIDLGVLEQPIPVTNVNIFGQRERIRLHYARQGADENGEIIAYGYGRRLDLWVKARIPSPG